MCNKHIKRARVSVAAQDDIHWWYQFSKLFNGRSAIQNPYFQFPLVSDASMKGFGAYLNTDWIAGVWPHCEHFLTNNYNSCVHVATHPNDPTVDYSNINILELWPIVLGIKRWYLLLKDSTLLIYTDNTQVKFMLTKGVSSNKLCMSWIRELYWICVIYNIQLDVRYVSTSDNVLADALSRVTYDNNDAYLSAIKASGLCCADKFDFSVRRCPEITTDRPET